MKISFKTQLLAIMIAIVIVTLLIASGAMFSQYNTIIQEKVSADFAGVMNANCANIKGTLNYIFRFQTSLHSNDEFKNLLVTDKLDLLDDVNRKKRLDDELYKYTIMSENSSELSMCFLVNTKLPASKYLSKYAGDDFCGRVDGVYKDENISNQQWYKDILQSRGKQYVFRRYPDERYVYFANVIRDVSLYNNDVLGVMIIGVDFEDLLKRVTSSNKQEGTNFFIVDDQNNIVAETDSLISERIYAQLQNNETSYKDGIQMIDSLEYGLRLVGVLDENEIKLEFRQFRSNLFLACLIVLIISIILSAWISSTITRPIKKLSTIMKEVDEVKDIEIYTKIPISEEVAVLYQSFNKMMFRISQLLDETKMRGLREKEMEIRMLQAQINPHFLYNALDSISFVALMHNEDEISEMVTILSDNFRYCIDDVDNLVLIEQEIKFICDFISFQEWRLEEKVLFFDNIDEKYRNILIPKFILQPIVENSILHGIGNNGNFSITFEAEEVDNSVLIKVIDNGVGCNVEELNDSLNVKDSSSRLLKFGIKNVNDRLRLKFGDKYGLKYEETPGGGVTAIITIPNNDIVEKGNTL